MNIKRVISTTLLGHDIAFKYFKIDSVLRKSLISKSYVEWHDSWPLRKHLYNKLNKIIDVSYILFPGRLWIPFNVIIPESLKSNWSIENQQIVRMKTVLKYNLNRNKNVINREIGTRFQDLSSFDAEKLGKMNKKSKKKKMYESNTTVKSNSGVTIIKQPLKYNLTNYF